MLEGECNCIITSELANQGVQKALFACVAYTICVYVMACALSHLSPTTNLRELRLLFRLQYLPIIDQYKNRKFETDIKFQPTGSRKRDCQIK